MRRFVLLVVAGWVSAVAVATCPTCINTNSSGCSRWGNGRAFFKWASDPDAGSDITLTGTAGGSCGGASGGESAKAYIGYVCDIHSDECNGESSPCDDGFYVKEDAVAIIKVSGSKIAFRNTLGGLSFTTDKAYSYDGKDYFYSKGIAETGCKYEFPMSGAGSGRIVLTAGIMNLETGSKGGKFNISVEFFAVLGKTGEADRYVRLAATEGSINVNINPSRNSNPVNFQPDLRDGSSMANRKPIIQYYSEVYRDESTDWMFEYRGYGESGCDQSEFWTGKYEYGNATLVPALEGFCSVKYPGWGGGVNGNPPYAGQSGWKIEQPSSSYAMLAMNSPDWLVRYLLMSSGYIQNTVYMMHYDMGNLGKMYYRGEEYSGGLRVRQIERCQNGQNFGEGQILWTFCYDAQDRIQYIHNASYTDPNNPPDPNSPDDATAYYHYQYEGTNNDPTVTYYTRPDTQSDWTLQRNWELEFDSEGRATKFQGGCTGGCGGTGTFEHVEYLPGRDDLITKQYNAADNQILDNQYEEIEYGQYESAGGIRIRNGGFESETVKAFDCNSFSDLWFWDITSGPVPVTICDQNETNYGNYLEFSDQTEQTLSQVISAVSPNSFYTLEASIRAHNISNKHGRLELWAVKGGQSSCLKYVDFSDPNFTDLNWKTISLDWNSKGDNRFTGLMLQDLWFFKVVVKGLKVDMDNIALSRSIWVGNTTKPILRQQQIRDSQEQWVTTLKREFDKDNYWIWVRQFVSANECRVIRYDYEDETFTNLVQKTEWQNMGTSTTLPTGTSYVTTYSNDANNVTYLPGDKRADYEFYAPCGKVSKTYRQDIENDANTLIEQYEYDVDVKEDMTTITDSRIKKHTNAAGGVTDYEYSSKLLTKKTDPQTAAGRLVTEYSYDQARRLTEEKKTKLGDSTLLHHTQNQYNPVTGFLDWTREDGNTAQGGYNSATTYYQYNSLGQVIRQTDPDGVKIGKSYGSGGQLVSEFTIAEGWDPNLPDSSLKLISQTLYTYTNDGLIDKIGKYKSDGTFDYQTSVPNPADPNYWVITKYEYYPDGKQKKVIDDFGTGTANLTTEYFYNLQGEVEKVIYPTGKWVKTIRDGRGLVKEEQTGYTESEQEVEVLTTTYDYDADGNLIEQYNPDGTTQIYTYDNFGRVKRVYQRDLDGPYTEKFYDNAGNVIRELSVDEDTILLKDIRRQYDMAGNLELERVCAEPNVIDNEVDMMTWYVYDVLGNLKKTILEGLDCCDPNDIPNTSDVITQYFYDGLGRKQHTIDPSGILSSVFYSPAGLPVRIVDPNDPVDPNLFVTENFYDAAGRLQKSVNPEDHYTVNTYNSLNQLIKQVVFDCNETPDDTGNDFAVRQTRTQYDNLGNVTRQVVMDNPASQGNPVVGTDLITDYIYDYTTGLLYQTKTYYGDTLTAAVTTFDYDDIGRKISTIDPEGNEESTVYYTLAEGKPALVKKTQRLENNPGGNDYTITTFYEYDDFGRFYKRILDLDGNGQKESTDTTTTYLYDGLGRLTNEIAFDGVVTYMSYDSFGNVHWKIEDYYPQNSGHFNKTTEYVYSRLNRLYRIKAYDPNDTTSQVSIQTTTYEYDKNGVLTKIIYPDNKEVQYIYNIQNKLNTEIQRNGKWIAYWYDQKRNLIQVSDYDENDPNWPTALPSSASFIETFTYDAAGNLKTADKVEGENPISHSEFTYNGFGLKTSETATYFELQPVTTTWDYDGSGNLISQSSTAALGCDLAYTHDGLGRIKTIDRGEDRIVNYSYIGSGTKAIEYPEPEVTQSYSYDELGRVDGVSSIDGDENTILDFVYDYDQVGNRQSEEYHHLVTPVWDKFYYDNLRRLKQVDYAADSPFATAIEQSDSETNRLTYLASYVLRWLDDGTIPAATTTTSVIPAKPVLSKAEGADRVLTLAEFGSSSDTDSKVRTETVYDDDGNIAAQIVYDANGNITLFALYPDDGTKVVITSAYDTNGNLTSQVFTTYDADGNVVSREEMPLITETTASTETVIPNVREESVDSATSSFSQADLWLMEADLLYGDGGMMLMSSTPEASEFAFEEFVYDNLGNRYQETTKNGTLLTYSHNTVNQYAVRHGSVLGIEYDEYYSHDNNGNLEMDKDGNIYHYDYRNRLTDIEDYDENTIAVYTYDALGRRIAKTVGETTTLFYYDNDNRVIAEYGQNSQDLQREYIYGNGFTEILAMFLPQYDVGWDDFNQFLEFCQAWLSTYGQPAYDAAYDHNSDNKVDYRDFAYFATVWGAFPSNTESHYYYLTDALGSIRGLVGGVYQRESDREFYNYDVYGASTDSSISGNPFRFAGYRLDSESGLYCLGRRIYEPLTGRFLQFDPIGYADSVNLYEYTKNNPLMFTDPYGLFSLSLSGKIESLLATRAGRGIIPWANLYNRIRDHYNIDDDNGEMNQSIGLDLIRFYADAVILNKSILRMNKDKWMPLSVPPPKPPKGEWHTGLSGAFPGLAFWLNEAHDIRANGGFEAQTSCSETYVIRKINVKYEWYDEIDANSYKELKNSGSWANNDFALMEAGWDLIGDKLLGSSFFVTIKWTDKRNEEIDVTDYVRQRGNNQ